MSRKDSGPESPCHLESQGAIKQLNSPRSDLSYEREEDFGFSHAEQRRIIRRIDRRLVVMVGAMYCVSLMDRTNMSAANIAGMGVELVLTGWRYNICNLVFFITYIFFQPPSTVIIRKLGPRVHLSVICLLWGAVMIGMGFVKNYHQLAGMRVLLGFLEAGFFPSCVYLLSTWYTRYEVGKRYSAFYILGCVASAFAGILAYGLMQLNGREGLTGWRWIFIIEGVITCGLAIIGYILLVDFPDSKRQSWAFLSKRECDWVIARINKDRGDSQTPPFYLGSFIRGGKDWKIWGYAMIFFNTTTITYALAYTLPILLVGNLGFSIKKAQCLVAPPYAFAGFIMFATAWVGDKYHIRGPIIVFNNVLALIGLPIMGWASNNYVRYFGVFLVTAGANANIPATMAFQANNVRGQWKRAFCSATLVGFGGIGGIAGSLVFREQDKATGYKPGMYACIACSFLSIILVGILDMEFKRQNGKAARGEKVLEAEDERYNNSTMLIAQLSPVTQLITAGDELSTTFSGLAATGDGGENVYLYFLKNSGPGTPAVLQQCSIGNSDPAFNTSDNPAPASTSRLAAVSLEDGTRLIFFQKANKDIQFINSSDQDPDPTTISNTGGNASADTPLAAVVFGEGDDAKVYLYYMSSQKKIMRATLDVATMKWITPA